MPNYLAPGVYIYEESTGSRPIERVGTSVAAFIGDAPNTAAFPGSPQAVNNWSEFLRRFVPEAGTSNLLTHAVWGFFLNGGTRCYVVNSAGVDLRKCLAKLEAYDDVKIVAAPGRSEPDVYDAVLTHCETMKDRVAVLDGPLEFAEVVRLKDVASVDSAPSRKKASADDTAAPVGYRARASKYGAYYVPWLLVKDPIDLRATDPVPVPPSGHIAGIYARTDATRGVHKAPANEIVRGAQGLMYRFTQQEQEVLNPNGVNCIRFFQGTGVKVWGARTLSADSEWRYLPVCRLFCMIEESIARSTTWAVFEPNDDRLWKKLSHSVTAFLTPLWREGALLGATREEAFFVKCDRETNPDEVIDAGQVVMVIGIAPVKPAEFVIFRIGQRVGGTDVDVNG